MSHIETSPVIITDKECLFDVIAKHFPKLQCRPHQKTYKWYGKWMNDYHGDNAAYKHGIAPEDYGKCDTAIHMEGVQYEMGLVKRRDGKGYSLVWDFFADGRKISEYVGKAAEKLVTKYSEEFARRFAQSEGYMINQTEDSESIYIEMTQ